MERKYWRKCSVWSLLRLWSNMKTIWFAPLHKETFLKATETKCCHGLWCCCFWWFEITVGTFRVIFPLLKTEWKSIFGIDPRWLITFFLNLSTEILTFRKKIVIVERQIWAVVGSWVMRRISERKDCTRHNVSTPLRLMNSVFTQYTKRHLTADRITSWESFCSRMSSKVSSDWFKHLI